MTNLLMKSGFMSSSIPNMCKFVSIQDYLVVTRVQQKQFIAKRMYLVEVECHKLGYVLQIPEWVREHGCQEESLQSRRSQEA